MRVPCWSKPAWGAILATVAFLGITCWWLTQDRSIPIFDAGIHLRRTMTVHRALAAGQLGRILTLTTPYPPFAYLVDSLGFALGGANVASPVLAENLVFVPLLALGCYQVGRRAFGPTAGFLAVVFALGSPLIISLFHVIMIDGPETAMVAVSLWAILASENFSRIGVSALAGLGVGLGMLTKEPFAFFVAGPLLVALVRGGWRNWEGLLAFAAPALLVALPWYIHEYSLVNTLARGSFRSLNGVGLGADIAPRPASLDNFEWYAWNMVNAQLYLPLFLLAAAGWIWAIVGFARRRPVSAIAPELLLGAFLAWLAITESFPHDTRYGMPLLVYLAVFAAGWIASLPGRRRVAVAAGLGVVAAANIAGIVAGAGETLKLKLPGAETGFRQTPGLITVFSDGGFLAGAPRRDGDVLSTLRALKRNGVRSIILKRESLFEPAFSAAGVAALATIAGLETEVWQGQSPERLTRRDAVLGHEPITAGKSPPCVKLSDGTGVWIVLGNPDVKSLRFYCPSRRPQFYDA